MLRFGRLQASRLTKTRFLIFGHFSDKNKKRVKSFGRQGSALCRCLQLSVFFFFFFCSLKMFIFGRFSFPRPYNDTNFFCHCVTKFVTCVGIASVKLGEPSIHNHILKERRCRRDRPWASLRSLVSATVSVSFLIAG